MTGAKVWDFWVMGLGERKWDFGLSGTEIRVSH